VRERLRELVTDLRRRAQSAHDMGLGLAAVANRTRLFGKRSAYNHAAEMVENLLRYLDEKQPAPRQELPGPQPKE